MGEGTTAAAALLTAGIATEAAQRGYTLGEDAAEWVENAVAPDPSSTQQPAPPQRVAAPAAVAQEPDTPEAATVEVDAFTIDPELPADLAELLDEPDDEPATAAVATADDDEDDDWYEGEDNEVVRLRRENAKLQKQAEHYKGLRTKDKQKDWKAEAAKHFPLSSPDDITADSRRSFLKQARAQHDALKPKFQEWASAERAKIQAEREQVLTQARADAEAAFGKPLAGPGLVPASAADKADALAAARKTGDLSKIVGVMLGNNRKGG